MRNVGKSWQVCDKRRLLLAMMDELAGEAHISFEGRLRELGLLSLPAASSEETAALKRNTLWPKLDFIVVPLERSMSKTIISAMGGNVPTAIIHIQIEKGGVLQFGAYDNFDPECIFFGSAVKQSFIEYVVSEGILRPIQRKHSKARPPANP